MLKGEIKSFNSIKSGQDSESILRNVSITTNMNDKKIHQGIFGNKLKLVDTVHNSKEQQSEFVILKLDDLQICECLIPFEFSDFSGFGFDKLKKTDLEHIWNLIDEGKLYFDNNPGKRVKDFDGFTFKFFPIIKIIGKKLNISVPFKFDSLM
jgi:hypothetical protein